MFYYLQGPITIIDANLAVVDVNGAGYACHTTASTLSQLKLNQVARLYTHCNIREDAFDIFGFATREELRYFQLLLGVSGVGPKAALAILSVTTPQTFSLAVMTGDERALSAAPGVGKKLAQRVILELKDKIGGGELDFSGGASAASPVVQGGNSASLAAAALAELGYSQAEIGPALKGVDPNATVEEMVRHALRAMVMKG